MIELGIINSLRVARQTDNGYYLEDEEQNEVLLPNAYIENINIDDTVEAFIYTDSEDRLVATTLTPKLFKNSVAKLEVKNITFMGAFLDWGLPKDIFVPHEEQVIPMQEGEKYWVILLEDIKTGRLFASSKLKKHLTNKTHSFNNADEVDLVILGHTDLGIDVLINKSNIGLVYKDDVYTPLNYGDELKGYIKRVREDGKIDVSIRKFGYKKVLESTDVILEKLKENGGELHVSDKSTPEEIIALFNISKKNFKKAIGSLYKEKLIVIHPNKITMNKK